MTLRSRDPHSDFVMMAGAFALGLLIGAMLAYAFTA
jgi:hypothetical protein